MSTPRARRRGILRPHPLVAAIAVTKLGLLLACGTAYGYVASELYSMACARHLAWGYAAHPPLSIAFLFGILKLYGESEITLRIIPALVGTLGIVLTARLAKRFGAGTLGQGLAALAMLLAPELLSIDHVFGTQSLEVLFTIAIAGLVARALTAPPEEATGAWVSVGLVAGLGLENDTTLVVYLGALAVGLGVAYAQGFRGQLGPLAALGVCAVVFAPYVVWESTHGWPALGALGHALRDGRAAAHPIRFVTHHVEWMLPTNAILWLAGLSALFTNARFAPYRPLGVAFVVAFVAWAFLGDPASTHVAPLFPILLAAGAAALDPWLTARRWRYPVIALLILVPGVMLVPVALPVLPIARYVAYSRRIHLAPADDPSLPSVVLPPRFAGMFGWPELVRSVDAVTSSLAPADREEAVVLASDGGQAGAIDLFGPALGLPPVVSGRGDFWGWGTAGASGKIVVAVGGDEAFLHAHFGSVEIVTVFNHSLAAPVQRRVRIYLCRNPVAPLDVMWPDFKLPL